MVDSTRWLTGVAGTDAASAKRGFLYQDIVTALAWTRLERGQDLRIEVAEDYAIEEPEQAVVAQVKHVVEPVTLVSALPFIDRVLQLQQENSGRDLAFVYLTTAVVGREQDRRLRPEGVPGIVYWQRLHDGADPAPLIDALRLASRDGSRLRVLLESRSSAEIVAQLLLRVHWAIESPTMEAQKSELREAVAQIAHEETGIPLVDGRDLATSVLERVISVSVSELEQERVLSHRDLRELIKSKADVRLSYRRYARLVDDANLASNPPLTQVNNDIQIRLDALTLTRFLPEASAIQAARSLARDVMDEGVCRIGDPRLRSLALSWCGRILVEEDPDLASELVENAARLADREEVQLVRALVLARTNPTEALRTIANLRSPPANTFRYAIHRRGGATTGLAWIKASDITPDDVDDGGKFLVLLDYLRERGWGAAVDWLEAISPPSLDQFPVLKWLGAQALVAWAAVEGSAELALTGPPVCNELGLRDDAHAMGARRRAYELFREFQATAQEWGLSETSNIALEFALWLMLEDKLTQPLARSEIRQLWERTRPNSRWLPLALRAGVDLDLVQLSDALDRKVARYGSWPLDDARARLALILASRPNSWIATWQDIRPHLAEHFDAGFIDHIQVKALLDLGQIEEARGALEASKDIPESLRIRFEIALDGADLADIDSLKAVAEAEATPQALHNLISALVSKGELGEAAIHAAAYFEAVGDHHSAEAYCGLLAKLGRWRLILDFLQAHEVLLEQSDVLPRFYVEALHRAGKWIEAISVAKRFDCVDDPYKFTIQLEASAGNWEEVGRLLENAYAEATDDPDELISFGTFAQSLGSITLAKRFAKRAVKVGGESTKILWQAYELAVRGSWEDDEQVKAWLAKCISTANQPDSPVRTGTLAELVDMAPQMRERAKFIEEGVVAGELFLAIAARAINRPLVAITAGTSASNERQGDFRELSPISAFAGVSRSLTGSSPSIVAMDVTVLLTMSRLGLLSQISQIFSKIYVPHGLGLWLLSEMADARFHQPSRIADAEQFLHAFASDRIRLPTSKVSARKQVASEVGIELAELVAACMADRGEGRAAYVIQSAPLFRAGTVREELADVSEIEGVLASTVDVLECVREAGLIPDDVYEEARAYLGQVDQGWGDGRRIEACATLYLDDLAVSYFQHLGVLSVLVDSGFHLVVHPSYHQQQVAMAALVGGSETLVEVLNDIREFYVRGQAHGLVVPLHKPNDDAEQSDRGEVNASVLLAQLFEPAEGLQAVLIDDRSANKNSHFSYSDETTVPVYSTVELLQWLVDAGTVTERDWMRYRTGLRRGGYQLVPVEARELLAGLAASTVRNGELYESSSAKAIRENILLAQASGFLRLPEEAHWITSMTHQMASTVSQIWCSGESDAIASIKSNWLVRLASYEGFAARMLGADESQRWLNLQAMAILRFVMNMEIPEDRREAYNSWLDVEYVSEIAYRKPKVFSTLCEMVRQNILGLPIIVGKESETRLSDSERKAAVALVGKEFINHLPASIREVVFADDELFDRLGLSRSSVINVNVDGAPAFNAEYLYAATAKVVNLEEGSVEVLSESGEAWSVLLGEGGAAVCTDASDARNFRVAHAELVADDVHTRLQYLAEYAKQAGIPSSLLDDWHSQLERAPISVSRIQTLERVVQNSPAWLYRNAKKLIAEGRLSPADIVPTELSYYTQLVPAWTGEHSIQALVPELERMVGIPAVPMSHLMWSSHQATSPKKYVESLSVSVLSRDVASLCRSLDTWSLVGLVECISVRKDAFPELEGVLADVLAVLSECIEDEARLRLTAALFGLVDSTLSASGNFSSAPVFWRRFASLTHAALLERVVLESGIETAPFAEWAENAFPYFQATTLADLNEEPRWSGFMLQPSQLRQELLGRTVHALEQRRGLLQSDALLNMVFGEDETSLVSKRHILFSGLPGPLEGNINPDHVLPPELLQLFEASLKDDSIPLSRRVLVGAQLASMASLPEDHIQMLVSAIETLDMVDVDLEQVGGATSFCTRIAMAASASRSVRLQGVVQKFLLNQSAVPHAVKLYAGLTSCGAEESEGGWTDAVGKLSNVAVATASSKREGELVISMLEAMCEVRPDLRPKVAGATARARGFVARAR
jgi:hypothetical protein